MWSVRGYSIACPSKPLVASTSGTCVDWACPGVLSTLLLCDLWKSTVQSPSSPCLCIARVHAPAERRGRLRKPSSLSQPSTQPAGAFTAGHRLVCNFPQDGSFCRQGTSNSNTSIGKARAAQKPRNEQPPTAFSSSL